MSNQQDMGDGRAVAATPSSQQDAVSPVPASIPIARDKYPLPEGRSGAWAVESFEISEHDAAMSSIRDRGRYVRPGSYTRLMRGGIVVMSDTPAEIRDLSFFRSMATGSLLINGLGMGIAVRMALSKPDVTEITVVERSADVVALVAPHLSDLRLSVVNANAFDWKPPVGKRYGAVWHDIWDYICADNLPEMRTLHRKYGRRADWQGSWCRAECERRTR